MNTLDNIALPEVAPDTERLASLVFELASQLHVERAQRIALETALERSALLPADWEADVGQSVEFERRCAEALDHSMDRLMRIMEESDDPRTPLRREAAGFGG